MSCLVPALQSLFDWGRSFAAVGEQLDYLAQRFTVPRAQDVIETIRAQYEQRYWAALSRRARREEAEAAARRQKTMRVVWIVVGVLGAGAAVAAWFGGLGSKLAGGL
jgi:hypothetical protein